MTKFCKSCGHSNIYHIYTWWEELQTHLMPPLRIQKRLDNLLDVLLEKTFLTLGIAKYKTDFPDFDGRLRSLCFANELKKRDMKVEAMKTAVGYNDQFRVSIGNKFFRFNTLPVIDFLTAAVADDKKAVKLKLANNKMPVAEGAAFWLFQKEKALQFGQNLGFPLIVKPRVGSNSQHVTTDIKNIIQLEDAIRHAIDYSPAFIIEKFIPDSYVFRATVVDFNFVAVVQQMSANVKGNGVSSIKQLIAKKNKEANRGEIHQKHFTLYKIVEDNTTKKLLFQKGYSPNSVLEKNEILFLQEDPFLKLGGDLVEVTKSVHKDNIKLFKDIAKLFNIHLVGIDFLARDISVSWKKQRCAVLELNNCPCIELHHFPSSGKPTNPAGAIADMFLKYSK